MAWSMGIHIPNEVAQLICDYLSKRDPHWWEWRSGWQIEVCVEIRIYSILTDQLSDEQRRLIRNPPRGARGVKLLC